MEEEIIIESFYTAFKNNDKERMVSHYHPDAEFQDPAFGKLRGEQIKNMWRMLLDRSKGQLIIEFSDINSEASYRVYNGIIEHVQLPNYESLFDFHINGVDDSAEISSLALVNPLGPVHE